MGSHVVAILTYGYDIYDGNDKGWITTSGAPTKLWDQQLADDNGMGAAFEKALAGIPGVDYARRCTNDYPVYMLVTDYHSVDIYNAIEPNQRLNAENTPWKRHTADQALTAAQEALGITPCQPPRWILTAYQS